MFSELASFTYAYNLLLSKGLESDNDSFRLHALEFLEIHVADPTPKLYVGIGFMAFSKHCRFHLVGLESKHSTFSSHTSDGASFLLYKATSVIEPDLHALFHDLSDKEMDSSLWLELARCF